MRLMLQHSEAPPMWQAMWNGLRVLAALIVLMELLQKLARRRFVLPCVLVKTICLRPIALSGASCVCSRRALMRVLLKLRPALQRIC